MNPISAVRPGGVARAARAGSAGGVRAGLARYRSAADLPARLPRAAGAGAEPADLGRLELTDDPAAQAVDADRPDAHPDETLDRRPDRAEHAAELALPALGQRRAVPDEVGRRIGAQQLAQPLGLDGRHRAEGAERREALVQGDPGSQRVGLLVVERRAKPDRVFALDAVARVQHLVRPVPIVGEEQQALGILVEPTDRIEPRAVGHERGRDAFDHGPSRRGGRGSST